MRYRFKHSVNTDLSEPSNGAKKIKSKPSDGIRESLKQMIHMTNTLTSQQKSKSPSKRKKRAYYGSPSISIHNLPLQKLEERPRMVNQTDKVMQLSERFGKIIKQKPNESVTKENISIDIDTRSKHTLIKSMEIIPSSYIKAEMLFRKMNKKMIKDSYNTFIYKIFEEGENNGRVDSVYTLAAKELNNTMIKQRQTVRVFAGSTVFEPSLLNSLIQRVESTRWIQLFLIKILYKKSLIGKIKELLLLRNRLNKGKKELRTLYKQLINKNQYKSESLTPFLCGRANAKQMEKNITLNRSNEAGVEDLKFQIFITSDKIEKLYLKLAFKLLKFEYLIAIERSTYLDLIIQNANKALFHLCLGVIINYSKIRKEKKEIVRIVKERLELNIKNRLFFEWKNMKLFEIKREEKVALMQHKVNKRLCSTCIKSFIKFKSIKKQKVLLNKAIEEYKTMCLIAKSFYLLEYFTVHAIQLRKGLKETKNSMSIMNRINLERICKTKIEQTKDQLLMKVRNQIKSTYSSKTRRLAYNTNMKTDIELVHIKLFEYQYSNYYYIKALNTEVIDINKVRQHAKQIINCIRKNITNKIRVKKSYEQKIKNKALIIWRIERLLTILHKDITNIKLLYISKKFLYILHEKYTFEKSREREAQKEYEVKLTYNILEKWKDYTIREGKKDNEKMLVFKKQQYFRSWRRLALKKAIEVTEELIAVKHRKDKLKAIYINKLKKIIRNKKKGKSFYINKLTNRMFRRWNVRMKQKKVLAAILSIYNRKKREEDHKHLHKSYNHWNNITTMAAKDKVKWAAYMRIRDRNRQYIVLNVIRYWNKQAKIHKVLNDMCEMIYNRSLRPRYNKWVKATEWQLERLVTFRTQYARKLLTKAFYILKREYCLNKLAKLLKLQYIMKSWLKYADRRRVIEPAKYHNNVLKHKVFIVLNRIMRKKRKIRELGAKYKYNMKRRVFVLIVDYATNKKRKRIVNETVKEFNDICLMRKGFVGIVQNLEKKRSKYRNEEKALTHLKNVRRNKEKSKKIIEEFNQNTLGIVMIS